MVENAIEMEKIMISKNRLYTACYKNAWYEAKAYAYYGRLVVVCCDKYFPNNPRYTTTSFDTDNGRYEFNVKKAKLSSVGDEYLLVEDDCGRTIFADMLAREHEDYILYHGSAYVHQYQPFIF